MQKWDEVMTPKYCSFFSAQKRLAEEISIGIFFLLQKKVCRGAQLA